MIFVLLLLLVTALLLGWTTAGANMRQQLAEFDARSGTAGGDEGIEVRPARRATSWSDEDDRELWDYIRGVTPS
jgi:hypothetical protein